MTFGEALKPRFKNYQKQIVKNAKVLAESLKKYGFNLVTGGTDNHLILIDLKNLGIDGLEAEKKMEAAGIMINRNSIYGDVSPFKPSGLRLGTSVITACGAKEKETKKIAQLIWRILIKKENIRTIRKEVLLLAKNKLSY